MDGKDTWDHGETSPIPPLPVGCTWRIILHPDPFWKVFGRSPGTTRSLGDKNDHHGPMKIKSWDHGMILQGTEEPSPSWWNPSFCFSVSLVCFAGRKKIGGCTCPVGHPVGDPTLLGMDSLIIMITGLMIGETTNCLTHLAIRKKLSRTWISCNLNFLFLT